MAAVVASPAVSKRMAAAIWLCWVAAVIGGVCAVVGSLIHPAPNLRNAFGLGDAGIAAFAIQGVTFASVGALLVVRRPENAVGRVLVVCGTGYALSMLTAFVAAVAAYEAPGIRIASVAAWLTLVLSYVGAASPVYLAFIFPTGRAHGPRWERVRRLVLVLVIVMPIVLFTQPGPLEAIPDVDNPFGIGVDLRAPFGDGVFPLSAALGGVVFGPLAIGAVVSRYRSARSLERQQLRWFISATVAALATFVVTSLAAVAVGGSQGELPAVVSGYAGAAVPIAIGVAILRYRLYDIDRLISRTLTYVAVSLVLATVYAAVVVTAGAVLGSFAPGNAPAVAVATLTVFAVFGPVRRRAQAVIDRRFDRSGFDARQALAALSDRLPDAVEVAEVEGAMITFVYQAFHPRHVSVWLRTPREDRRARTIR